MKKSIIAILVMLAAAIPSAAQARTVGTVLSTDIGTVIDGAACKTYNVDGCTFVVAEDLQGYGFDIDYNDNKRMLTDLEKEYVSDVKDACIVCESSSSTYTDDYGKEYYKTNYTDLIYIIKTDGTLWYYKNKDGEFARVKAFE